MLMEVGSHRRTETGQLGDVAGQALELPVVTQGSHAASGPSQLICAPGRMWDRATALSLHP